MSNQPDRELRTLKDQALQAAWRRFLDYNTASNNQKRIHTSIRRMLIVLALFSSILAVSSTYVDNPSNIDLKNLLRWILIVLPILMAGLLTYASQFAPSLSWISYRTGAELLRREIYLYRMRAGAYAGKSAQEQKTLLLQNIETTETRVYEIGAPDPHLQSFISDEKLAEAAKGETDDPQDDGFTTLSLEDYITLRLIPQMNWYIDKAHNDYERMRRWQVLILITAGLSSMVAVLNEAPLVAVTTAIGVAIAMYMDLRMYGHTYAIFHPAANRLQSELNKWRVLSPQEQNKPEQAAKFVESIEDVFQFERDTWMESAIQTQRAIEQTLTKSVGERASLILPSRLSTRHSTVAQVETRTTILASEAVAVPNDAASADGTESTTSIAALIETAVNVESTDLVIAPDEDAALTPGQQDGEGDNSPSSNGVSDDGQSSDETPPRDGNTVPGS